MGRMMMYRDDYHKQDMLEYAYEIKKTACKIIEALEDGEQMSERGRYRGGNYRNNTYYRGGRYRDGWDDMDYRNGRYGD